MTRNRSMWRYKANFITLECAMYIYETVASKCQFCIEQFEIEFVEEAYGPKADDVYICRDNLAQVHSDVAYEFNLHGKLA